MLADLSALIRAISPIRVLLSYQRTERHTTA